MNKRIHAPLITLWAQGNDIQRQVYEFTDKEVLAHTYWVDDPEPSWEEDEIYRVKPDPTRINKHWYLVEHVRAKVKPCFMQYHDTTDRMVSLEGDWWCASNTKVIALVNLTYLNKDEE